MTENSFYKDGLRFSCTRCSLCCRFDSGYVFLSENDVRRLSRHLGLTDKETKARFCREVDTTFVPRLSLKEQPNFDCIFWQNGECTVYEGRPLQCRTYPFWPPTLSSQGNWDAERRYCPGINVGELHSAEKIDSLLAERQREPLLEG
jgi:uncharacterized protein